MKKQRRGQKARLKNNKTIRGEKPIKGRQKGLEKALKTGKSTNTIRRAKM